MDSAVTGEGYESVTETRVPSRRTVEVLIVSYNTVDLLIACIRSVSAACEHVAVTVEVAVFDNGSTDGSAKEVRRLFPAVRVLESRTNVGFAQGNNRLAESSYADYLLLLNSDTLLIEDIVTPLVTAMEDDAQVALVAPRLVSSGGRVQYSSERFPTPRFEFAKELWLTKAGNIFGTSVSSALTKYRRIAEIDACVAHRADCIWATCWLLRTEDVRMLGLFDEHFVTYDEDLDFCWRLRERGRTALYEPSVSIVHLGGASSTSQAKRELMYHARAKYYRRHHGRATEWRYRLMVGGVRIVKRVLARLRASAG